MTNNIEDLISEFEDIDLYRYFRPSDCNSLIFNSEFSRAVSKGLPVFYIAKGKKKFVLKVAIPDCEPFNDGSKYGDRGTIICGKRAVSWFFLADTETEFNSEDYLLAYLRPLTEDKESSRVLAERLVSSWGYRPVFFEELDFDDLEHCFKDEEAKAEYEAKFKKEEEKRLYRENGPILAEGVDLIRRIKNPYQEILDEFKDMSINKSDKKLIKKYNEAVRLRNIWEDGYQTCKKFWKIENKNPWKRAPNSIIWAHGAWAFKCDADHETRQFTESLIGRAISDS